MADGRFGHRIACWSEGRGTPPPGCFGKRGCKRLKTKEGSAEKIAKKRKRSQRRGTRGCKPLRTWDLPPRQGRSRQGHGDTEALKRNCGSQRTAPCAASTNGMRKNRLPCLLMEPNR